MLSAPRLGLNAVTAPRSDPGIIVEYQRHWWAKDPTRAAAAAAPVGRIISLRDAGGADRFAASAFHNEFWRRSGHARERLAVNLATGPGALASLGVQPRPARNAIEGDMAVTLAALVPHLVRSVEIRWTLRRLEMERELARAVPKGGAMLVGADAAVIHMDDHAATILAGHRVIRVEHGRVLLRDAVGTARLHRLIASCGAVRPAVRGGRLALFDEGTGRSLRVEVLPLSEPARMPGPELLRGARAAALLVLSDPTLRREAFLYEVRRRFGLTPAEAAVAFELTRGERRGAVAARLGVLLATVRTHMTRVFAKLGVRSQPSLLLRMADAGIALDPPDPGADA